LVAWPAFAAADATASVLAFFFTTLVAILFIDFTVRPDDAVAEPTEPIRRTARAARTRTGMRLGSAWRPARREGGGVPDPLGPY
jgi:hypothetical protein